MTVICVTTTSVPSLNAMVPTDRSVPRAKVTFVRPDGGVAAPRHSVDCDEQPPPIPTSSMPAEKPVS